MGEICTVTRLKITGRQKNKRLKFLEEPKPPPNYWVIEALETSTKNPHFLVGVSKGRCFFLWDDNIKSSKKFESELHAYKWARDNRLLCGFRVTVKFKQQTRRS